MAPIALPNALNRSAIKTDDTATNRKKRNRAITEANSLGCTMDPMIAGGFHYINGFRHVKSRMQIFLWKSYLFATAGWLPLADVS
jgi:hypothetical protein